MTATRPSLTTPLALLRRPGVHHPLFARLYSHLARAADRAGAAEHRDELLAGLSGTVVEVGCGTGTNFVHYPDAVTEVVAVEPEPYMRAHALDAADRAPVPVRVVAGVDHDLPAPTGWADAVVASLVLCSVAEQAEALAEMRRVVRPGGELRFYEHVRADSPAAGRWQERLDVVWPHLFGGCHTSRDTVAAIEAAGWQVQERRDFDFMPGRLTNPVAPHTIGRAFNPPLTQPERGPRVPSQTHAPHWDDGR